MMDSLRDPVAKVHGMDLFDISFQLHQLKWYMKNQVPALHPLSGFAPGPGEVIDPHLGMSLPGNTVAKICFLLEQLSWVVDERVTVQREAGSHKSDYLAIYRTHFAHKIDISVFDSEPKKLPQAPKRLWVSSYRCSLRSFRYGGHVRAGRGRFSRRHRPSRLQRAGNASGTEAPVLTNSREQSPEI